MTYSIASVLDLHAPLALDCLVYACLDCGSISMASCPEDVAPLREHYEMVCCSVESTVYP